MDPQSATDFWLNTPSCDQGFQLVRDAGDGRGYAPQDRAARAAGDGRSRCLAVSGNVTLRRGQLCSSQHRDTELSRVSCVLITWRVHVKTLKLANVVCWCKNHLVLH
jgi:hypothetical protein